MVELADWVGGGLVDWADRGLAGFPILVYPLSSTLAGETARDDRMIK